jgi:hypothetical protein
MRKIGFLTCALVCYFASASALPQSCKPDISREDRITKEQVEVWTQVLSSTSFAASFMSTSELTITATVGRYGALNAVNLQIQKKEESATNAAFESAMRGAKGSPFYFGFKSGSPAAFVVTDVGNNAKVEQGLLGAKGVTTVILSAVVTDGDMAALRNALTSQQIDGIRIVLAGNDGIEKSVDDKNGKKLMEKFSCFYQSLDSRGIALSGAAQPKSQPEPPASVSDNGPPVPITGQYITPGGSHLLLFPDGSFTKFVGGGQGHGQYALDSDNLTLKFTSTGFSQQFKVQGGKLLNVNTHQGWTRTGDSPETSSARSAASSDAPTPPPPAKPTDSGPTLAATMQFIQEKLSEQGQVAWAETVSVQPDLIHRKFISVADVMADPAACTLYTTETVDDSVYLPKGKTLTVGGKPVTADHLRSHTVETDTISFRQVESVAVEKMQDIENQAYREEAHPEITVTETPPVFYLKVLASNVVFSAHTSTSKGNQAPVEKDATSKMNGHTFRDEDTANHVAKAMIHAMELCGGGVTKKDLF